MRISIFGALAFALGTAIAGQAGAQTIINADVTTDTTWSGTVVLQQAVFVKNGAVLTIEPGTIVRGQPRTAAVLAGSTVGVPGTLIVTNNGTIIADGTAQSPIIMTTAAVDNDQNGVADDVDAPLGFLDEWQPGDLFLDATPTTAPLAPLNANGAANVALWGGLVILGNSSTNLADGQGLGLGKATIEGLTVPGFPVADATYGGSVATGNDLDSSGSLSYVSIRHAGDEIGNSNELNGVSLGGVGSGTELHHVEVYCNFDDGIEWFGGTVNGHHLTVVFAGDDTFDLDQGYRGTNQFLVGIMPFFNTELAAPANVYGSAGGDKGCECDGDDNDIAPLPANVNLNGASVPPNQPTPFPNMNFYNVTIAGSRPSTIYNGFTNDNDGWEERNGWAGSLNNALIFNTGGAGNGTNVGRQAIDLAGGGVTGWNIVDNTNAGRVTASGVTCDNVQPLPALSATNVERTQFTNGTLNNDACISGINDPNFRINAKDTSFQPKGVAGKLNASLVSIDLRPSLPNATMAGGIVPPLPLDNTATYRGAYSPTAAMWTDGWTALSMAGMQPVPEPGLASMLGAGAIGLMAASRRRR